MQNDFYKRFDISIDLPEVKRRFMNRIRNAISTVIGNINTYSELQKSIPRDLGMLLGEEFPSLLFFQRWLRNRNFWRHLEAAEAFYASINGYIQQYFDRLIGKTISLSECDLGITWQNGKFYKKGAPILDQKLVNESLGMLRDKKYENVTVPFEKGLKHLLRSQKEPERLADAITDMYEALEALAKVVCENDKDLSGNREEFIAKINAPEFYKKVLKEYINYACQFRHALKKKGKAENTFRTRSGGFCVFNWNFH